MVGRKLVRRLMALMDIRAIYPMKSLSKEWLETCETYVIKVSMDGRARCLDNIWIERFWRTIKREYIYWRITWSHCGVELQALLIITTPGEATRESGTKSRPKSMRWPHRKKDMAKSKIIPTFVSTSKTQSTTYSEGSAPRKY